LDKNETIHIKVMRWNKQIFDRKYGLLFESAFPNIEVELIEMGSRLDSSVPRSIPTICAERKAITAGRRDRAR